jgi:hypothetical protein
MGPKLSLLVSKCKAATADRSYITGAIQSLQDEGTTLEETLTALLPWPELRAWTEQKWTGKPGNGKGKPPPPPDDGVPTPRNVWETDDDPRLPPHSLEAEQAICCAVVTGQQLPELPPEAFYTAVGRNLMTVATLLVAAGKEPDLPAVVHEMRRKGLLDAVGGAAKVAEFVGEPTVSILHVQQHEQTVRDCWYRRRVSVAARKLAVRSVQLKEPLNETLREHLEEVSEKPIQGILDWHSLPAEWLFEQPPNRDWLLVRRRDNAPDVGLLPKGIVGMLIGAGGASKTMFCVQLALLAASGSHRPLIGDIGVDAEPGKVLLMLGEEDAVEAHRRIYRAALALRLTPEQRGLALRNIFVLPLRGVDCALVDVDIATKTMHRTTMHAELLRRLKKEAPWSLIIADPVSRFSADGTESANSSATKFVSAFESFAIEEIGRPSVLLAHHTSQAARTTGDRAATAARGVTGLTDGVRWVANLTTEPNSGAKIVAFNVSKNNYSAPMTEVFLAKRSDEHGGALVPVQDGDIEEPRDKVSERREKAFTDNGERIMSVLANAPPEGMLIGAIETALAGTIVDRTLRRRMDALEASGYITAEKVRGDKGKRYRLRT